MWFAALEERDSYMLTGEPTHLPLSLSVPREVARSFRRRRPVPPFPRRKTSVPFVPPVTDLSPCPNSCRIFSSYIFPSCFGTSFRSQNDNPSPPAKLVPKAFPANCSFFQLVLRTLSKRLRVILTGFSPEPPPPETLFCFR